MKSSLTTTLVVFGMIMLQSSVAAAEGNADRGARVYGVCAACHSLEPNRNMTGPSLAGFWNRTAGGLASFRRYSAALKSSRIIWEDGTLDEWLRDPQQFIPGNQMTFPGVRNEQQRSDRCSGTPGRNPISLASGGFGARAQASTKSFSWATNIDAINQA